MSNFKDTPNSAQEQERKKTKDKAVEHKRGRPRGKRSNPDYEQVTAYIKKKTYKQIKIALLEQDDIGDFSELVEELLSQWLNQHQSDESDI
jgi:hypothetical protein